MADDKFHLKNDAVQKRIKFPAPVSKPISPRPVRRKRPAGVGLQ